MRRLLVEDEVGVARGRAGSAAVAVGDQTLVIVEVAVAVVAAVVAEVVTNQLDLEVKVGIGGGLVLEHGEPGGAGTVANTEVHGSPVTDGLGAVTPLATLLGGNTLVVDVVLSGGSLALPLEVGGTVGAGQRVAAAGRSEERNRLRLSTGVVSTANRDVLGQLVADVDTTSTGDTDLLGESGVGEVELAVLALKTTNGLAGGTLGSGPLGLLVTSRAGIRAHGAAGAGLAGDSGDNVTDHLVHEGNVLDTRPATDAEVVQGDGTVVGGEGRAVELSIGEVRVDTGGTRAGAGARGAAGSRGLVGGAGAGAGAGGRAGSGLHGAGAGAAGGRAAWGDGSGSLNQNLGSNGGGRRRGDSAGAGASAGRAGSGDGGVKPLQLVVSETGAGVIETDGLGGAGLAGVHNNEIVHGGTGNGDGVGLGLNSALVEVSVAMTVAVSGRQRARRGKGHGNGVGELHCKLRSVSNCEYQRQASRALRKGLYRWEGRERQMFSSK